jgi:uncharacterized protein (TIGR01777 family)
MKVLVTGASGLVGTALCGRLAAEGHAVFTLVRRAPGSPREIRWDPDAGTIDASGLEGLDAVVHLAGESVAGGRWTPARKKRIRDSRWVGTKVLCDALAGCAAPPKVIVSSSAIGYYGDRGAAVTDEAAPAGAGFLADVCVGWEAATAPAAAAGIRVVLLRTGIVLSTEGGALAKLLPPFKLGLGGVAGNPETYMSWITLEDLVGAIDHALHTPSLSGPVNGVAPNPVTNRAFTKALAAAVHRPAFFNVPAFVLKAGLGEMAEGLLLQSLRGTPARLLDSGYRFEHPTLEAALAAVLAR